MSGEAPVLGIFVGGKGTRMGGRDKAALPAPDTGEASAVRLARLGRELGLPCVVVGAWAAHETLLPELPRLRDEPEGIGPLGGLGALLSHCGARDAIAVACDMPRVEAAVLQRLVEAPRDAAVLAPREAQRGKWQPLFARYDAKRVLPALQRALAAGERSFQALFARVPVKQLLLSEDEQRTLVDWDRPEDVEST
jgi:molybdopterin-guanine dinucleotide biosynthesis protein A